MPRRKTDFAVFPAAKTTGSAFLQIARYEWRQMTSRIANPWCLPTRFRADSNDAIVNFRYTLTSVPTTPHFRALQSFASEVFRTRAKVRSGSDYGILLASVGAAVPSPDASSAGNSTSASACGFPQKLFTFPPKQAGVIVWVYKHPSRFTVFLYVGLSSLAAALMLTFLGPRGLRVRRSPPDRQST